MISKEGVCAMDVRVDGEDEGTVSIKWLVLNNFIEHLKKTETFLSKLSPIKN